MSSDPCVVLASWGPSIIAGHPNPVSVWTGHNHLSGGYRWSDSDAESNIQLGGSGRGEKEYSADHRNPKETFHSDERIDWPSRAFRVRAIPIFCAPTVPFRTIAQRLGVH